MTSLSASFDFVYCELDRTTLDIGRFVSIIKYWLKIINCDVDRYIKGVYNAMLDLSQRSRKQTWITQLRDLLCSLGLNYAWQNQMIGNTKAFVSLFKQR